MGVILFLFVFGKVQNLVYLVGKDPCICQEHQLGSCQVGWRFAIAVLLLTQCTRIVKCEVLRVSVYLRCMAGFYAVRVGRYCRPLGILFKSVRKTPESLADENP